MFKNIHIKRISSDGIKDDVEAFIDDAKIRIIIDDSIEVVFVCLAQNLHSLVYGYLSDIRANIKILSIENNQIFVQTNLAGDTLQNLIKQKDLVGTCEGLESNRLESNMLVIPFNDTRYRLDSGILSRACEDFYADVKCHTRIYRTRIISLESSQKSPLHIDCSDTNPKTSIYKILGINDSSLLESIILLDFVLDFEILQILIQARITFVIARGIQNFATLRTAQKFGLTMGYFDGGEVRILSQISRIV